MHRKKCAYTVEAEGKGRSKAARKDNVKDWTGMTLEQALRSTVDRKSRRAIFTDAANPRTENSRGNAG